MDQRAPEAFEAALSASAPPADWAAPLAALWWAAKGATDKGAADRGASELGAAGWNRAHALVQDAAGADAAWVHAHLHRIEGDPDNAGYWYRRAGRAQPQVSLDTERAAIAGALMSAG